MPTDKQLLEMASEFDCGPILSVGTEHRSLLHSENGQEGLGNLQRAFRSVQS